MPGSDIQRLLKREGQLNTLSYTIMVVLLSMIVALIVALATDIAVPEIWVLGNQIARTLFVGLLLTFIVYLFDQHRRLRASLLETHSRLELANGEIAAAYERLSFAQHTASVMSSLTEANALERVLTDATRHFGANAAAVVGDDVSLISDGTIDECAAQSAVLQVALDAVRAGKALVAHENAMGGEAIAVPLRIRGELKSVVCLWRQEDAFSSDQLEGLVLMSRIVELSLENRLLLAEVSDQLDGTLSVLSALLDQRIPDYQRHAERIADHAVAIGKLLGLHSRELSDMRISALLADVGLLQMSESATVGLPDPLADSMTLTTRHPSLGADVARHAGFSVSVQETILAHHERLDGSGYPAGRRGDAVPMTARILAVCDVYDTMTSPRPGQLRSTPVQAISTLMRGAGKQFDAEVVRAFLQVIGHDVRGAAERRAASPIPQPLRATCDLPRPATNASTAHLVN